MGSSSTSSSSSFLFTIYIEQRCKQTDRNNDLNPSYITYWGSYEPRIQPRNKTSRNFSHHDYDSRINNGENVSWNEFGEAKEEEEEVEKNCSMIQNKQNERIQHKKSTHIAHNTKQMFPLMKFYVCTIYYFT